MKNLIYFGKILSILIWGFTGLTSCKEKDPTPTDLNVTADDLVNYYLVAEGKTSSQLVVAYFIKDGDEITVDVHKNGQLRRPKMVLGNSTLTLDYESNGNEVYTFALEKDSEGNLKLKSYDLSYQNKPNQLSQAVLVKMSDAFPFVDRNFNTSIFDFKIEVDGTGEAIKWENNPIKYPIYRLGNFGFKTLDGGTFGVAVPSWNVNGTNGPRVLIQIPQGFYYTD
ncbi:hypothetical protein [Dyadobacter sp. CY347]|uniref:hypothetical protein n=1 Tax=Dyadobacter sp. CY347 TaxID=2909336 RepID=UPI001F48C2FA|nr:hypothetical protein [Dyadobacter sp. CY347]MCF2488052.1 hypothetical protein [Dyadobacter sp. CY347]